MESLNLAVEHLIQPERTGVKNTISYKWKNTAGTSMHIHVSVDEFGVINSLMSNVGSSGTTTHNLVNALGRVITIAIQKGDVETIQSIIHTLEGMTSETTWMHDELGRADSIPNVLALILLRHIDIETAIENMHSGEEE